MIPVENRQTAAVDCGEVTIHQRKTRFSGDLRITDDDAVGRERRIGKNRLDTADRKPLLCLPQSDLQRHPAVEKPMSTHRRIRRARLRREDKAVRRRVADKSRAHEQ